MTNNRTILQECAMRYGTSMGLLWIFKFALFPLGLMIPFLQLLFLILTLGVPVVGYVFARRFRDRHCEGGVLPFWRAFLFTVFMYMFASMLVCVAHYIYFRYLDGGFVMETYRGLLMQVKESASAELMPFLQQYEEALDLIAGLSPLELTFQMISNNIFMGVLMAIPTALLVMRNKTKGQ